MLIAYTKLIGHAVAEIRTQTKVGSISDLIINNEDLSIAAFIVETGNFLFSNKKIVSAADVVQIVKDGVIIRDEEAVIDIAEAVRVKKLFERKYCGLYQKVVTKSGHNVGQVFDYLIDSATTSIKKFYIRHLVSEVIISVGSVVEYVDKVITIKDDKAYAGIAEPVMETAVTQ